MTYYVLTKAVVFGVEIIAFTNAHVLFGIVITREVALPVTVTVPLDSFAAKISATMAAFIAVLSPAVVVAKLPIELATLATPFPVLVVIVSSVTPLMNVGLV